jgi:hypothetical protein
MDDKESWDLLKAKILSVNGIVSIESKDCKMLSLIIQQQTKKRISETTLKRIFGFAAAHFEPSKYTKNLLSQYCGYRDWEGYVKSVASEETYPKQIKIEWQKLKEEINKVNSFMLRAVKNKAVIPFEQMITRDFIEVHFDHFINSGAMATVLTAPTGYGKTIAICKWLDQKMKLKGSKDLILYFNSSFLLSSLKTELNLNYWMMKMMGLEPSGDFQRLVVDESSVKGQFYFVLDGFDEYSFSKIQFENLMQLLLDVLSIYKQTNWFKVVIVMRNSSWLNWRMKLMSEPDLWFVDGMNDRGQNVNSFTLKELETLIHFTQTPVNTHCEEESFEILSYPLFHQIYYKRYRRMLRHADYDEIVEFEIVNDYMTQNIIHGNETINKMDFIFYFLELMKYNSDNYQVDKSKIQFKQLGYLKAYSMLLQIGFLSETEFVSALHKKVYVRFSHLHFLGCCIAAYVLHNDPDFKQMKLEYIVQNWNKKERLKNNILKWCVFLSYSLNKQEGWINGYDKYLSFEEHQNLSGFLKYLNQKTSN